MSYLNQRMLSEIDALEDYVRVREQVRELREKERKSKSVQTGKYNAMFAPITNSLKHINSTKQLTDSSTNTDQTPDDFEFESGEDSKKDILRPPGESYLEAVHSISPSDADDGVFGLNYKNSMIGHYKYLVSEDILHAYDNEGNSKTFHIKDYDLWRLLLAQTPNKAGISKSMINSKNFRPVLNQYFNIVKSLDLVNIARKAGISISKRRKYLLLSENAQGKGFLFSTIKPEFLSNRLVNPSAVVIPSDRKQLLRALLKGVAEMRSGNTSMRNIVVPLAMEAKRLKILPKGLLSSKEMSWVFA
jgi:hypothetical protein